MQKGGIEVILLAAGKGVRAGLGRKIKKTLRKKTKGGSM